MRQEKLKIELTMMLNSCVKQFKKCSLILLFPQELQLKLYKLFILYCSAWSKKTSKDPEKMMTKMKKTNLVLPGEPKGRLEFLRCLQW